MAKLKEVTLKMVIDNEGNVQKLEGFSKAMEEAGRTTKRVKKEVDDTSNALGEQSRATNLAGQSALEMSRIASDAAYGIRGMANNIGQVATMMIELHKEAPKTIGWFNRIKWSARELWSAIMGPMGILIAIQGFLSLMTVWSLKSDETTESQKKLNKEIEETNKLLRDEVSEFDALVYALKNSTGEAREIAEQEIRKLIPKYDELRKSMGKEWVLNAYAEYLDLLEDEVYWSSQIETERSGLNRLSVLTYAQGKLNEKTKERIKLQAQLKGVESKGGATKRGGYAIEFYGRPAGEILAEAEAFNEELMSLPYKKMAKYGDKAEKLYERLIKQSQEGTIISTEQIERLQALQLQSFLAVENAKQQHVETKKDLDVWWYKSSMDLVKKETKEQEAAFKKRIEMQNFWTEMTGAGIANTIEMLGSMRAKNIEDEEEAFQHQKKIRTVTTIIDTLVGAQKAFNSQLIPGDPTSLVRAGVAATIAMTAGAARVAAIQAEQFKSTESTDVGDVGDTTPVTTTGFSNLSGGETPGSAVRVYVLEHDIRTTTDKVSKTKVRSRL